MGERVERERNFTLSEEKEREIAREERETQKDDKGRWNRSSTEQYNSEKKNRSGGDRKAKKKVKRSGEYAKSKQITEQEQRSS